MNDRCADPTFGIKSQALAILQLLAGQDPIFANWNTKTGRYEVSIKTFPWYAGREKGVCLVMGPKEHSSDRKYLHIAFGEDRGTDGIFVEKWEAGEPFNCPTLESRDDKVGDEAYQNRASFPCGQIGQAADYIVETMRAFYEAAKETSS